MVSPGVFASDAAPLPSESPSGTTTATITTSGPKKAALSSSVVSAAEASATVSGVVVSLVSYGNSGLLGVGKRWALPTAWS